MRPIKREDDDLGKEIEAAMSKQQLHFAKMLENLVQLQKTRDRELQVSYSIKFCNHIKFLKKCIILLGKFSKHNEPNINECNNGKSATNSPA